MRARNRCLAILVGSLVICVAACGPSQKDIAESGRLLERARDHEEAFEALEEAILKYRELAKKYPQTPAGLKATVRTKELEAARTFVAAADSVSADSMVSFYERFIQASPGYPPALRKLGRLYYNQSYLFGRSAAKTRAPGFINSTMRLWARQDSLWSRYEFRATTADRTWRDRLCRQAIDVGRMLQELNRYQEALDIVNQGIGYASGDDMVAVARVYAAYYTYTLGDNPGALKLADEALGNEHLSDGDRALAYPVVGLAYLYTYEDSGELPDLDAAISALNESVNRDPGLQEPKELLKALRAERGKLPL